MKQAGPGSIVQKGALLRCGSGYRPLVIMRPLLCIFCAWALLSCGSPGAQTYDFGYVPLGSTNKANGFNIVGNSYNGTNLFMASESIIGPNAADFMTSTNYAGQFLPPPSYYFYSLSFVPRSLGFETAALSTFETPSPPFGAGIIYLQAVGAPTNRPAAGPIVPELAPLEQAMTNFLAAHSFEAGTLAVMKDSKLVFRQGYGWRDTNFTTVIHPDNLFRIASVTKMLTASSIYKLIAAGKISSNTKVFDYVGIAPWNGVLGDTRITNITVQNLLDHAGGWNQYTSPVFDPMFHPIAASTSMGLNYPAGPTNVIAWMFSKPLDFAPGSSNVYCNLGYSLLGRVIEKASGKPYMDYIHQDLLVNAGLTNALGFTNVIQSRSRPRDLDPWEIWYADQPQFLPTSAVDFPTNLTARFVDGGDYYEAFDSCLGLSASAIGLCRYLQSYLEAYNARVPGSSFSWDYKFYGSAPGASSVLVQNVTQNSSSTNGIEFAALFNERDDLVEGANAAAYTAISNAIAGISSWPANGGGMIQWSNIAMSVNKNGGFVNVPLVRSGANNLSVKVSYTTYALTATSSNFFPSSGVVTFGPGVTSKNVTIPIFNDHVIDPTRQFSLELISASGGAWLGDNLSCVVSILDTNSPPSFTGSPVRLPNGNFQFQTLCNTGLVMTVQSSTNLTDWQNIQTFTNATSLNTITDTNANGRAQSFYRLVVP
jgi:CubicO group peptidase (beta-lactamase class C family)